MYMYIQDYMRYIFRYTYTCIYDNTYLHDVDDGDEWRSFLTYMRLAHLTSLLPDCGDDGEGRVNATVMGAPMEEPYTVPQER